MKRILAAAIAILLLCSGCASFRSAEYWNVEEHVDPFSYKETTEPAETAPERLTAGDYYELRAMLLSLMTDGIEHAEIYLESYNGRKDEDLKRAVAYVSGSDPVGAYAIDYINYELTREKGQYLVTYDAVYRRSASEIASIRSVRGNEQANTLLCASLEEFAPSVTLQISGYSEEDFEKTICEYCLYHPDKTVPCTDISVSVYPDSGNVRVVEIHLQYDQSREELRMIASDTAAALSSAYDYMRYGRTALARAELALSYLVGRFDYEQSESASVYSLLCEGIANSTAFSSAFAYLCQRADIPCVVVNGTKDGEPYTWTMLQIDELWYHADISATVLQESRTLNLLTDGQMAGYSWDTETYPVCTGVTEESQPSEDG